MATSSRGEEAVLILETRKNKLTTKYRSVELFVESPASTIPSTKPNRKVNPARAKRSKLRMELFTKRKLEEKQEEGSQELAPAEEVTCLATGDTSSTPNKLVLDMSKDREYKPDVKVRRVKRNLYIPLSVTKVRKTMSKL